MRLRKEVKQTLTVTLKSRLLRCAAFNQHNLSAQCDTFFLFLD